MTQFRAPRKNTPKQRLKEAIQVLKALDFTGKQTNATAGYVLLSLLDLEPNTPWADASSPLRGITPIIDFIAKAYRVRYAPNTRETIRDEAVKYFVEAGLVARNPDDPHRPTNSKDTAYQIEASALSLCKAYGTSLWDEMLKQYISARAKIRAELESQRVLALVPVQLPDGQTVRLSPGGQNPLIKDIVEHFCARFTPGAKILYLGDSATKFKYLEAFDLEALGVTLDSAAKMPDVVVHDVRRNWLVLIEAVATGGVIDAKRRNELKSLFSTSKLGLVFVTAFPNRKTMQAVLSQISWETEVWVADAPDHLIHFNGERFLGPYPDVARAC